MLPTTAPPFYRYTATNDAVLELLEFLGLPFDPAP